MKLWQTKPHTATAQRNPAFPYAKLPQALTLYTKRIFRLLIKTQHHFNVVEAANN